MSTHTLPPEERLLVGRPVGTTNYKPWIVALLLVLVFAALAYLGYMPRRKRDAELAASVHEEVTSVLQVTTAKAKRAVSSSELTLPGDLMALVEAPVFARSEGYVSKRLVGLGQRVKAGQVMAEIEAPEIDQQVRQARASVAQARATVSQQQAGLIQSNAQLNLAKTTLERWQGLVGRGVFSKQEGDQKQADYDVRAAEVQVAQANVSAAREALGAQEANLKRLQELQGFSTVRAPFDGTVTARITDVGSLIKAGATEGRELFRVAQVGTIRIFVQVPQTNAPSIRVGQPIELLVPEFPNRKFIGVVNSFSNALDRASRTMLAELRVPNKDGALLPGMYAQVKIQSPRITPPVLIPGDAVVVRAAGAYVATVQAGSKVHFQKVQLGRDFGTEVEVPGGLQGGETVIVSPSDDVQEGVVVKGTPMKAAASQTTAPARAAAPPTAPAR